MGHHPCRVNSEHPSTSLSTCFSLFVVLLERAQLEVFLVIMSYFQT